MGPRRFIISVLLLALVAAVPLAPRLAWQRLDEREHTIIVLDKTVPRADYREHAGLFWLLNHYRVVQGAGNRDRGSTFDPARDYFGYLPERPPTQRVRPLQIEPGSADMVYLADTHGVYERASRAAGADTDPPGARKEAAAPAAAAPAPSGGQNQRRLVHGGLTVADVEEVKVGLREGGTLVAEYDTLGPPTPKAARSALEALLGIRWSGWSGRHFSNLGSGGDLPAWVRDSWERANRQQWRFSGGGYLFVHADGRLVVLREGEDVPARALRMRFARDRQRSWNVPASTPYDYWFDVVRPATGSTVAGTYELAVRKEGRAKLIRAGVATKEQAAAATRPIAFPAVTIRSTERLRGIYIAADAADLADPPDSFRRGWLVQWRARTAGNQRDDQRIFFWRVYAPLLEALLDDLD